MLSIYIHGARSSCDTDRWFQAKFSLDIILEALISGSPRPLAPVIFIFEHVQLDWNLKSLPTRYNPVQQGEQYHRTHNRPTVVHRYCRDRDDSWPGQEYGDEDRITDRKDVDW